MRPESGAKRHRNAILAAVAAAALALAFAVLSSCGGTPGRAVGGPDGKENGGSTPIERNLSGDGSEREGDELNPKETNGIAGADPSESTDRAASKSAGHGNEGLGSSGSNSNSGSGNDGSSSSSGSSGGNAGGSSSSGSPGGSKPSHTHNWVAQTENKWIQDSAAWDEQVWVQDSAAWTEKVETGSHIQCSCGATFNTSSEWGVHNREQMITTGQGHRYSVVPTYEEIYHEATGHYETVHHEATGHYETVTTGYKCSGCGAKK